MKQVKLYASASPEMLKAPVEKIELRFDWKKPSPIEKSRVLLQALYQAYETDSLNVANPFRRQRTQTRFNFSHQHSRHTKDAAWSFINAVLKIFKGGLDSRKDFFKARMQPVYQTVSPDIKKHCKHSPY